MSIVSQALGFASCAHRHQVRKYTNEPYIVHCKAVADILEEHTLVYRVIAAGVLHDVIEDCDVTSDELRAVFGDYVADLVIEVTDISNGRGNRTQRKQLDREHLARTSPEGACIKLADLIDNTKSVVKYDKNFARTYLEEKELLLPLLNHGDARLWARARRVLNDAQRDLLINSQEIT